jgi:hypothetical protein
LAYSLYLLQHNIELQGRLLKRLLDPSNFQGAYYELIVANALIRAGFKLMLEDETDGQTKHCEFSAISQKTGKKYWVEAKMRAVHGYFGKVEGRDGTTDENPVSHLSHHINGALRKPASDERLIFVDLNTEAKLEDPTNPSWSARAISALEGFEARHSGEKAYVFVTNFPFHRDLRGSALATVFPFGLGMPNFNRPGVKSLSDAYRAKQSHIDAYDICESMGRYMSLPSTFDGSLPSETFGESSRLVIGESYMFDDLDDGKPGLGRVESAIVVESEKAAHVVVRTNNGRHCIMKAPLSESELQDYKAHPEAYFGKIQQVGKNTTDPFEFFERLMQTHAHYSRESILRQRGHTIETDPFKHLSDDDLRMFHCESIVIRARASEMRNNRK